MSNFSWQIQRDETLGIPKHIDFLKIDLFGRFHGQKLFLYSSNTMKLVKNWIWPIQAKFGPKIQSYGPKWCFLVHTNPIDEKTGENFFSLNKGAILLQHLASKSDRDQALFFEIKVIHRAFDENHIGVIH